jgi:hypothetical protein
MATWIKENTVPEDVGKYDPETGTLIVSTNLKVYPNFSFTKPVSRIIPNESDKIGVDCMPGVALCGTWGGPDNMWLFFNL